MDKQKQKAIEHHNAALINNIDPQAVVDNMFVGLLSLVEKEFIKKSNSTRRDTNCELIFILFRKREELEPFEHFVEALKKTDASHKILAKAILKTYKQDKGTTGFETVSRTSLTGAEETNYGLQIAQKSLKEMYLARFQKVHPFFLPFTFDIENTWVSLALKGEKKDSQAKEDHAELLKRAFDKVKMLIIEGDPATGKTYLMRRLAYEWAKGKQELLHYDFVLYAEFREVREKTFESIVDLVLYYSKNYMDEDGFEILKKLVNNEKFCKECRILVLLDGYNESSLEKQCAELSSYINDKMIKKALLFNTIITTRKAYLSTYRDVKKRRRLVFAEVFDFTTKEQKDKYIFNHFLSKTEIENKKNIAVVRSLLDYNESLNKLAETPLFLAFICLVHERIIDGTLVELYCNIIWWLIDRHQKDYPDQNIPSQFEFQTNFSDKFETIQDHFLHFPQLHCLGKMAQHSLQQNIFEELYCAQFNVQPIIKQVGLLRKEKNQDDSFRLATSFIFPHRTIQDFLAAFYCFCSNDQTSEWLLPNSKLNTSYGMNEFERFLLRIALSDKMPIHPEKRKHYFETITDINLDISFDAFNTTAGFNNQLLNWFLSQCTNVQNFTLTGKLSSARHRRNMLNNTYMHHESAFTSNTSSPALLSYSNLIKLHSLTFWECAFSANSQLSFKNCPSLKYVQFNQCEMKSNTFVGIATLPAIDTVHFFECAIDLATWQSITDQICNSNVKYLHISAHFFAEETYPEFLHHLQKCERIQQIHVYDVYDSDYKSVLKPNEEPVTANLALTAQQLPALTSITISGEVGEILDENDRLNERNRERIEKAGRERNPDFSVKYVGNSDRERYKKAWYKLSLLSAVSQLSY